MEQMEDGVKLKIVLVGDSGVGKTTFLYNLTKKGWEGNHVPTAFSNYELNVAVGKQVFQLDLWDTEVSPEYERLRPLTYPATDIVLLCYDITRRDTLDNIESKWLPEVMKNLPQVLRILIGNKSDLRKKTKDDKTSCENSNPPEVKSLVSLKEVKAFAKKHNLRFAENSSIYHNEMPDLMKAIVHAWQESRNHCRCRRGQRRRKSRPGSTLPRPKSRDSSFQSTLVTCPDEKEESGTSQDDLDKDEQDVVEETNVEVQTKKEKQFPKCSVM